MSYNRNSTTIEFDRRSVLRRGLAGIGAAALFRPGMALADCATFTAEMQQGTSPTDALELLMQGNARFAAGEGLACDPLVNLAATTTGQSPLACVLTCIDSRVPPEVVFDQQIGDLFVARVAGNVPTAEILGSFEYATRVAGTKAILVLGHSHCGAVKGAVDRVEVGERLSELLGVIEPAVAATPLKGERDSHNQAFVDAVTETNVRMAVVAMTAESRVMRELVDAGQLVVAGGIYDIETGRVRLLAS